jgi:hypothetical protein
MFLTIGMFGYWNGYYLISHILEYRETQKIETQGLKAKSEAMNVIFKINSSNMQTFGVKVLLH